MNISQLPQDIREAIWESYEDSGWAAEDLESAMNEQIEIDMRLDFGFWQ